jgi:hypothetical protein
MEREHVDDVEPWRSESRGKKGTDHGKYPLSSGPNRADPDGFFAMTPVFPKPGRKKQWAVSFKDLFDEGRGCLNDSREGRRMPGAGRWATRVGADNRHYVMLTLEQSGLALRVLDRSGQ